MRIRGVTLFAGILIGAQFVIGCAVSERQEIMVGGSQGPMYPRQVQRCLEMQKQNRLDDAIACYTEVLSYSEGNKLSLDDKGAAVIYNNRGLAYASKSLYNQSISDFERAIQLDPSLKVAAENLQHFKEKAK